MFVDRFKSKYYRFRAFSDVPSIYRRALFDRASETNIRNLVPFRIRDLQGNTVYCRTGSTDMQVLEDTFVHRYHRLPITDSSPRTILDLGANIGLTVADYACLYPTCSIVGVELDESNACLARMNTAPFSRQCSILTAGIWTSDTMVSYAGSSAWAYRIEQSAGSDSRKVQAYCIPTLMQKLNWRSVDFVKMDIEGAERQLLKNAGVWINSVRSLKVEVHGDYNVTECVTDLQAYGFQCEIDMVHPRAVFAFNRDSGRF